VSSTLLIGSDNRPLPGPVVLDEGSFSYTVEGDRVRVYAAGTGGGGSPPGTVPWGSVTGKPAPIDAPDTIVTMDPVTGDVTLTGKLLFPGGHYITKELGGSMTDFEFWHGTAGSTLPNMKLSEGAGALINAPAADANSLQLHQSADVPTNTPQLVIVRRNASVSDFINTQDALGTTYFRVAENGAVIGNVHYDEVAGIVAGHEILVNAEPLGASTTQFIAGRYTTQFTGSLGAHPGALIGFVAESYLNSASATAYSGQAVGTFGAGTNDSNLLLTTARGVYGTARVLAGRSGGITAATALYGLVDNRGSGAIASGYGVSVGASISGSGNVTTFYGVYVRAPSLTSTGVIGTNYGLYMEAQAGHAIYTNAGLVRFGDAVTITGALSGAAATFTGLATLSGQVALDNALQDKISLLENRLGLTTMYGFGVEGSTLYYKSASIHRWYVGANADGGASDKMELTGTVLTIGVPTVTVAGTYFATNGSTSATFDSKTTGDASYRWRMRADGSHLYGDGTSNLFTWSIVAAAGLTPVGTNFGASGRFTRLGIGVGAQENYGQHMSLSLTGASSSRHGFLYEVGVAYDAAMGTSGTVRGGWIRVNVSEDAALTRVAELTGLRIGTPTKGASLVTIDSQAGLRIDAQTLIAATPAVAIYQVGTSDGNRFDGPISMGQAPDVSYGIRLQKGLIGTGVTQYGVYSDCTFPVAATNAARAYYGRVNIPNSAYTVSAVQTIYVAAATKGASATVTTAYGLYMDDQTVGSANWNLYVAGTAAANYIGGRLAVGINSQTTTAMLSVRGSVQTTGVTQIGAAINPTFDNTGTTAMTGVQVSWSGSNTGTYTTAEGYGINVLNPTKGTNQTITTLYGVKVNDITAGTNNFALHTGLGLVRFGDSATITRSQDAATSMTITNAAVTSAARAVFFIGQDVAGNVAAFEYITGAVGGAANDARQQNRFVLRQINAAGLAISSEHANGMIDFYTSGLLAAQRRMSIPAGAPGAAEAALLLQVNDGAVTSVRRVTVGAVDSGGAGYRLLRVPN
jgi:hypothetical protein